MTFQSLRRSILASTVFALLLACGCGGSSGTVLYSCNSVDTEGYHICTDYNDNSSKPACASTVGDGCIQTGALGYCSVLGGDHTVWYYSVKGKPTVAEAR